VERTDLLLLLLLLLLNKRIELKIWTLSLTQGIPVAPVAEEIPKYKLDLVGVQEVRCDGGGIEPAGECTLSMERGVRIMN
jgi:hypothetical protein